MEKKISGKVINIQRFTIHDGPGIRTEVFLKGCPLHCMWCSNPESINKQSEVGVYPEKCLGIELCGHCLKACEHDALVFEGDKILRIDRNKCVNCLKCAQACVNDTLKIFGVDYTVGELMDVIKADRKFYDTSGGGVTFSGGDPLIQWRFLLEVLKECKKIKIHTCVESELFCNKKILDAILPYTDLFISDIKHMDTYQHQLLTNVGNEIILDNIKYLVDKDIPLVLRIPIVTGYNDSDENIRKTGEFIRDVLDNKIIQLQLLPYRPLGEDKYAALGLEYPMKDMPRLDRDKYTPQIYRIVELLQEYGVPAVAGALKLTEVMQKESPELRGVSQRERYKRVDANGNR